MLHKFNVNMVKRMVSDLIKKDLIWFPIENPWKGVKVAGMVLLPFTILLIIGYLLNIHLLTIMFALSGSLAFIIFVALFFDTVIAISINNEFIALKFPSYRIKILKWSDIKHIYLHKNGLRSITLKTGGKSGFGINANKSTVDNIIKIYKQKTNRKVLIF